MSEHYRSAIDILTNPKIDFRALAIQVAKDSPEALVSAFKALKGQAVQVRERRALFGVTLSKMWDKLPGPIFVQIIHLLEEGQKVEAIKAVRNATGLGLKEAKDEVDAVCSLMVANGPPSAAELAEAAALDEVPETW